MAFEIKEEWYPMPLQLGPPLPRSMQIYWPWVTPPEEIPAPPKPPISPLIPPTPKYRLYIYTVGKGTVTPADGAYPAGSVVTLTASPEYGATFDHWAGDAAGASSMVNITMNRSKSATAYFKAITPPPYEEALPPEEIPEVPVVPPEEVPLVPVVPPEAAPELDLGEIAITGINGRPFKSARGGIGVLAEPITVSSLRGATVNWRNKSVDFDDRLVGILFFMTYEGVNMSWPCEDGPGYRGIFLAGARRGTFEASTLINRDWAGGNWCPGIYQGHFMWRKLYRDEDYRGGGDFMISHFKCTGKGSYEPSPEIYPLV